MIPSRIAIGLALRHAREAAGLTLKELATRSGCTFSMLSRTELGERDVAYAELLAVLPHVPPLTENDFRELALTFEREVLPETRKVVLRLNDLQRLAITALIETGRQDVEADASHEA